MRTLILICLAFLLAASRLAGAQTLGDANRLYERGDYEKARVALERLVQEGNTEAEFKLAGMYVDATGVQRNTTRGMILFESAARKGHTGAMFFLATELAKGGMIQPDKVRSLALFRTAAKLKHGGAQFALCMELGDEFSKYYDALEAYAWCMVASKKEHKKSGEAGRRAKATLEHIKFKQGAEAVQEATNRAAQYVKTY